MTGMDSMFDSPVWEGAHCAKLSIEQADMLFFTPGFAPAAAAVCEGCPFVAQCLLLGEKFKVGVFGGVPPENRSTGVTDASKTVTEHPFDGCEDCVAKKRKKMDAYLARKRANGGKSMKPIPKNLPHRNS